MWKTKVLAAFLVFLLSGILFVAYSLPTSTIVISSTGKVSPAIWTVATPVNASGINAAVTSALASGGGTVNIPSGDWDLPSANATPYGFGGTVPIDLETLPSGAWLNIIGLGGNTTVTTNNGQVLQNVPSCILRSSTIYGWTFGIEGSTPSGSNLNFVDSANRHIRISGITILSNVTSESNGGGGIALCDVDGFLIDHCAIDGTPGAAIYTQYSKGVISNCQISFLYHLSIPYGVWGYGVQVEGNFQFCGNGLGTPTWITNVDAIRGKYDWQGINITYQYTPYNTYVTPWPTAWATNISFTAGPIYIEGNTFNYSRHAVASSQWGYYVFRYNLVDNGLPDMPMTDMHGGARDSLTDESYETLGGEVYNNTLIGLGPTGQYGIESEGGASLIFNNTIENVEQGILLADRGYNVSIPNDPTYVNNTWLWNNTFINVANNLDIGQGVTQGVNFFCDNSAGTGATSPAPPPSGYTPYVYPNPLTLG